MKIIQTGLIGVAFGILVTLVFHQTLADEEYADDIAENLELSTIRSLKDLTPEEEALANEARSHIAKTIENNLVRLLAIVSARGDRRPRQEDEDEDAITPNPNVLPQVAQILGAIFTGGLNITRVVDRTFGLVPNIVRNQVGGIVKLLTGETVETASSTVATATAGQGVSNEIIEPIDPTTQVTNEAVIVEVPTPSTTTTTPAPPTTTEVPEPETEATQNSTMKGKYRIRNRTRAPTTTTLRPLEDDEIQKLEDHVRRAARAFEPEQDVEPRQLAEIFRNVVQRIDFNMTEITRAVPSIFKGTRQAFTVLENLGLLDVNDVLDELDLPELEEEEEEEDA